MLKRDKNELALLLFDGRRALEQWERNPHRIAPFAAERSHGQHRRNARPFSQACHVEDVPYTPERQSTRVNKQSHSRRTLTDQRTCELQLR
jgi:hypothetical protein